MTTVDRHLAASRGLVKFVPVDVSLVMIFLQIFLVRGCFCKIQAAGRISLMISISMCKSKQKLLD